MHDTRCMRFVFIMLRAALHAATARYTIACGSCVHETRRQTKAEIAGEHRQYLVRATYLEIYQEEVRDLLSKTPDKRLEVKESADKGVYVKGLVHFVVKSVSEINSVLQVVPSQQFSHAYPVILLQHTLSKSSKHQCA